MWVRKRKWTFHFSETAAPASAPNKLIFFQLRVMPARRKPISPILSISEHFWSPFFLSNTILINRFENAYENFKVDSYRWITLILIHSSESPSFESSTNIIVESFLDLFLAIRLRYTVYRNNKYKNPSHKFFKKPSPHFDGHTSENTSDKKELPQKFWKRWKECRNNQGIILKNL